MKLLGIKKKKIFYITAKRPTVYCILVRNVDTVCRKTAIINVIVDFVLKNKSEKQKFDHKRNDSLFPTFCLAFYGHLSLEKLND